MHDKLESRATNQCISIHSLSLNYSGYSTFLFIDELTFKKGKTYGITGESGSGKSSLLECLGGIDNEYLATEGSIKYDPIAADHIGYIGQHADQSMNPRRSILNHFKDIDPDLDMIRFLEFMNTMGLPHESDDLAKWPYQNSGGQNQRISWLLNLWHRKKIILADEPITHVHYELKEYFIKLLTACRDEDTTTIIASHDIEWLLGVTDEMYEIRSGKLQQYRHQIKKHTVSDLQPVHQEILLSINGLNIRYDTQNILKNYNAKIYRNEILGIFGPSGSGKSTLLKAIAHSSSNKALHWNTKLPSHRACYIGQDPIEEFAPNISIGDYMSPIAYTRSFPNWTEYLKDLNLIPSILDKKVQQLSGGQIQRLAVIKAIISNADLIILDECLSGLDDDNFNLVKNLINKIRDKSKKTFLICLHDSGRLNEVSDRLLSL